MLAGRKSAGTHRAVLHQLQAGAEVGQADVAVHVQQDVVWLDVPERKKDEKTIKPLCFVAFLKQKKATKKREVSTHVLCGGDIR